MYNILISGYYGFDNIGDESILRTLVTSLRERIPDCSLTVLSHDPAATREKYGVEAVERMSPLAIARAVRRCDMLISGGGSLLQDVTSSKSLHYYLAIIRFAQLLGKKVFIYSQGIGPIEKDADRRATARALRRADGIVVRDERSAALLAEIGVPAERVVITADPVIRMKKPDGDVGAEILRTKKMYEENWSRMEWLIERWTPKASTASAKISKLQEHILVLEEEVEVILMERIRDKANAERYDRMIAKREEQIAEAKKQIEELQNISEMLRSRQAKLKRDISLIDDILREGKMSEAHLRMLVEKILVHEEDGRLDLEIRLKAPFRDHLDIFENGEQTDCIPSMDFDYDRLGAAIYGDYYAG